MDCHIFHVGLVCPIRGPTPFWRISMGYNLCQLGIFFVSCSTQINYHLTVFLWDHENKFELQNQLRFLSVNIISPGFISMFFPSLLFRGSFYPPGEFSKWRHRRLSFFSQSRNRFLGVSHAFPDQFLIRFCEMDKTLKEWFGSICSTVSGRDVFCVYH